MNSIIEELCQCRADLAAASERLHSLSSAELELEAAWQAFMARMLADARAAKAENVKPYVAQHDVLDRDAMEAARDGDIGREEWGS